jgi:hypothetical protein
MKWLSKQKKSSILPRAHTRFETCTMWIKNHVRDDTRERMVVQFVSNAFMKPI